MKYNNYMYIYGYKGSNWDDEDEDSKSFVTEYTAMSISDYPSAISVLANVNNNNTTTHINQSSFENNNLITSYSNLESSIAESGNTYLHICTYTCI